ncbi:MAG TPA: phosphatase PAP2 family protein [Roseiarcus sp.]|nr:phosphatase PAP2 family protein [Roseiarcus sp.]
MSVFDFPSRAAWAALVLCAAAAFCGLAALGVAIRPLSLALPLAATALCLAASTFYRRYRPDRRLAAMTAGAGFLLAFSAAGGALTYPAAAIGGPLQDKAFIAFERALGVDWPALAAAMSANPYLNLVWALAYMSSLPMLAVVVVALTLTGREERLANFLSLFVVTLLTTVAGSVAGPALGPIPSYGISGEVFSRLGGGGKDFLADFQALRAHQFAVFDLVRLQGIITFPSFHCVLAVLTAWALAPIRWLGRFAIGLSVLVVLSTIPQGGHYVADICAGLLIGFCAIAVAAGLRLADRPAAAPALAPAE